MEISVKYAFDKETRFTHGNLITPAIIVTEQKVKSQGNVPVVEVVKEWIKDL